MSKVDSLINIIITGSSDSGDDAVVGNVNKLLVYPPGYTGKPKKGHLIFDACFESGNMRVKIHNIFINRY